MPTTLEGRDNPFTKSVWYDFLYPLKGLNSIRDKPLHDRRRRMWDRGFSTSGAAL